MRTNDNPFAPYPIDEVVVNLVAVGPPRSTRLRTTLKRNGPTPHMHHVTILLESLRVGDCVVRDGHVVEKDIACLLPPLSMEPISASDDGARG